MPVEPSPAFLPGVRERIVNSRNGVQWSWLPGSLAPQRRPAACAAGIAIGMRSRGGHTSFAAAGASVAGARGPADRRISAMNTADPRFRSRASA